MSSPALPMLRTRPLQEVLHAANMRVALLAVTLANPALSVGSRRLPASKSICTSTIGMPGLCTRYTCAPEACVHCSIGMPASELLEKIMQKRPVTLVNIARAAIFLIVIMG